MKTTDKKMLGDLYTSREVMDNLTVLCDDFGSRFAGTPGEKKAAHFLRDTFEKYGLQAHLEEYTYQGWTRGPATLRVCQPIQRDIPCISLPYCPAGEIQGELVDGANGTPRDFEKAQGKMAGNFVMVSSLTPSSFGRWIHRKEKYSRAVLAGAGAFLYVNQTPGLGPQTGSLRSGALAPVPGVSLSYENGKLLERLLERHGSLTLQLITRDTTEERTSWNIVADLGGTKSTEQVVVLCSHYDGHDISQGAIDPASGVAVVLESARLLSLYGRESLDCTLRFICWGTEEIGLIGSHRYVEKHSLDNLRFIFNLDACGGPGSKGIVLHQWPDLEPTFQAWARETNLKFSVTQYMNAYSDHFPFALRGIPSCEMVSVQEGSSGRGYTHSSCDTLDKVSLGDLQRASDLACRLGLRMASLDFSPKRRSPEEVIQLIENHGDLEGYRVQKALEKEMK